jgi:myo-inositol-1(or 4)-monophosphatase
MSPELASLCSLLRTVAEREIMTRFHRVGSRRKEDGSLVTDADLAAQRSIAAELTRSYPEIPLLGEEMTSAEQERLLTGAQTGVWCLDPLDGTSNYAGGFPFFGLSLALLRDGEAVLGVVFDPVRGECFCAERGGGAFLNGEPLATTFRGTELRDCLALVDLKRLPHSMLIRLGGDAPYRSQRNLGSVVLDWCWIAAGRAQLYLHGGQKLWDYAAGRLIAAEAGVPHRLLGPGGTEAPRGLSLAPRMAVVAANRRLYERWTRWLGLPQDSP